MNIPLYLSTLHELRTLSLSTLNAFYLSTLWEFQYTYLLVFYNTYLLYLYSSLPIYFTWIPLCFLTLFELFYTHLFYFLFCYTSCMNNSTLLHLLYLLTVNYWIINWILQIHHDRKSTNFGHNQWSNFDKKKINQWQKRLLKL